MFKNVDKKNVMEVIYAYDALCGWCYGFSPVIERLYEQYQQEIQLEVLSGGMVTGDRIGPIGAVAGYISEAYKVVENRTGIEFGEAFLNNVLKPGDVLFTSIPPAVALSVFKSLKPENAVQFAGRVQKAIYFEGLATSDPKVYGEIAAEFGLDRAAFLSKLQDPLFLEKAQEDFNRVKMLGISGFPTVLVGINDGYYPIAQGYLPFDQLEVNYQKVSNGLV